VFTQPAWALPCVAPIWRGARLLGSDAHADLSGALLDPECPLQAGPLGRAPKASFPPSRATPIGSNAGVDAAAAGAKVPQAEQLFKAPRSAPTRSGRCGWVARGCSRSEQGQHGGSKPTTCTVARALYDQAGRSRNQGRGSCSRRRSSWLTSTQGRWQGGAIDWARPPVLGGQRSGLLAIPGPPGDQGVRGRLASLINAEATEPDVLNQALAGMLITGAASSLVWPNGHNLPKVPPSSSRMIGGGGDA